MVDRVVRTITRRNRDHDYNDVTYVYFDDGLNPRFIKGQLLIPEKSAKDAHNLQLSRFYQQMFSNALPGYWEDQQRYREHQQRPRDVKAMLAGYFGLAAIIPCVGLFLAPAALILGMRGLRSVRKHPKEYEMVHAVAGIVLGSASLLVHLVILFLALIGIMR